MNLSNYTLLELLQLKQDLEIEIRAKQAKQLRVRPRQPFGCSQLLLTVLSAEENKGKLWTSQELMLEIITLGWKHNASDPDYDNEYRRHNCVHAALWRLSKIHPTVVYRVKQYGRDVKFFYRHPDMKAPTIASTLTPNLLELLDEQIQEEM